MRSAVVAVLVFIAGVMLGIRLLAALYAPLDLWYTIGTAWPTALRRIVGWAAATVGVFLLLDGGWRRALLLGIAAHLVMHAASWLLILLGFPKRLSPTKVVE